MIISKKISIATAVATLTPFLIIAGLKIDDVKLVDGNEFSNEAAYEEYRNEKLADKNAWKMDEYFAKAREMSAIYTYEIKKNNLKFTLEEIRNMKGTDIRQIMETKILAK